MMPPRPGLPPRRAVVPRTSLVMLSTLDDPWQRPDGQHDAQHEDDEGGDDRHGRRGCVDPSALAQGRDLDHVEDVAQVQVAPGELGPRAVVDREVAERVAGRRSPG